MEAKLRKPELLQRILAAVEDSGWSALLLRAEHPFKLRLFRADDPAHIDVTVFIWNITHGGGAARPANELRIQLTGTVPTVQTEGKTLLVGWNEGYRVFVAFDIRRHDAQASSSPSIQVARSALLQAHTHSFAIHTRGNRETVVAFRPEYLIEYVRSQAALHSPAFAKGDLPDLVNSLDTVTDAQIDALAASPRRMIVQMLKRKYRERDFAARVLSAYRQRCAVCGVQLKLVEAAHILPVAADGSTDDTTNGLALCALHHRAFDTNLFSFNESYEVQVSNRRIEELRAADLLLGMSNFQKALLPALALPADRRDYPSPTYIASARRLRCWAD